MFSLISGCVQVEYDRIRELLMAKQPDWSTWHLGQADAFIDELKAQCCFEPITSFAKDAWMKDGELMRFWFA